MIKKSELWQRIRAARKRAGYRQSDVSDRLGVDRTAITQWESKNPERRTRPDIGRLEDFGKITRTPLWWLLSDDVDIEEAWPEVVNENEHAVAPRVASLQQYLQDFWSSACLRAREKRSDLWDQEVWAPSGPRWMMPLLPDAMSPKAMVQFVNSVRPDLSRIASAASALIAFEHSINRSFPKKAVMVWKPRVKDWPNEFASYLENINRISTSAHTLCDSLQVAYLEVTDTEEAAEYLAQIL